MAQNPENITRPFWQRAGEWLTRTKSTDPIQARRGRLLAGILFALQIVTLVATVGWIAAGGETVSPEGTSITLLRTAGVSVVWLYLYIVNRRGGTALAGGLLALVIAILDVLVIALYGPLSPTALMLIVPVIIAGFFAPPISALIMAFLVAAAYLYLSIQANPNYFADLSEGGPFIQTLLVHANLVLVSVMVWMFSRTTKQALEESRELSLALVAQRQELEARLAIQTRQLQATTTVARAVAGSRNLDQLMDDVVRLVRETFGYYHAQIFLVDEAQEYAILRQSSGEVGQTLLARGHRLPVGSLSVIGQVTASGRPVIARDTDSDFVHKRNELLPHTRSELAVPLVVGDSVIGALDMQSTEPDDFADEMLATFQALGDQIAIAIENARLFESAESNLRDLRELSREATQRSWAEFLAEAREEDRRQVYGPESKSLQLHRSRVIERVLGAGSIIVSTGADGRQTFLAAPIVVRNEVIGVLAVEPEGEREWTQDDLQMMRSIAERTATAIENARLYLQAQRAAERERLINTIASRLQRAPSLALLLETATRELAEALGTENVYAEISMDQPFAHTPKTARSTKKEPTPAKADETPEDGSQQGIAEASGSDESEEAKAEL